MIASNEVQIRRFPCDEGSIQLGTNRSESGSESANIDISEIHYTRLIPTCLFYFEMISECVKNVIGLSNLIQHLSEIGTNRCVRRPTCQCCRIDTSDGDVRIAAADVGDGMDLRAVLRYVGHALLVTIVATFGTVHSCKTVQSQECNKYRGKIFVV